MRFVFVVAVVLSCGTRWSGAADETLKFFLSKCQYALAGEVLAEPAKRDKPFPWDGEGGKRQPMAVYEVRVQVLEQYQYDSQPYPHKEMTLYVLVPVGADRPMPLEKGAKCIFFLNWRFGGPAGATSYVTADPWFGVQRLDPKMAERLRQQGSRPPRTN
jgi:hypothetical protein